MGEGGGGQRKGERKGRQRKREGVDRGRNTATERGKRGVKKSDQIAMSDVH